MQNFSREVLNLYLGQANREVLKVRGRFNKVKFVMIIDDILEDIRWMLLRLVELSIVDGFFFLFMYIFWVRVGILVVGMDNEMYVYFQWRSVYYYSDYGSTDDFRCIEDLEFFYFNLENLVSVKFIIIFKFLYLMLNFKYLNFMFKKSFDFMKLNLNKVKSESLISLIVIYDFGFFEVIREVYFCFFQYYSKSMMELLNFGKVRRVKVILVYLVRCICNGEIFLMNMFEEMDIEETRWGYGRNRVFLVGGVSLNEVLFFYEEFQLEYKEIFFILSFFMYVFLAVDEYVIVVKNDLIISFISGYIIVNKDYSDLFFFNVGMDEEFDINVLGIFVDSNVFGRGRF